MNEVIHSLDSSETGGRADFTQAVKMASKVFSISTECHNTLVVMTDNDADSAMLEGALNVYNTEMEVINTHTHAHTHTFYWLSITSFCSTDKGIPHCGWTLREYNR